MNHGQKLVLSLIGFHPMNELYMKQEDEMPVGL
jgi:hypothetical protein